MKKVIFVFMLLISAMSVFSQSENVDKENRMKFGFNFGLNWSSLFEGNPFSATTTVSGANGWRLGVLADYRFSKKFSFSPKAELSFNQTGIVRLNPDNSIESESDVMPVNLELMGHVVFNLSNKKSIPYLLIGPNVKIPISNDNDDLSTSADFAIDFGIGIEKAFTNFNLSPELRYSYGLLNISQDSSVPDLRFHTISLVFNFKK